MNQESRRQRDPEPWLGYPLAKLDMILIIISSLTAFYPDIAD
jgi:hypothetical protein